VDVLGGSAAYTALTAHRLGWEVGVLTSAGPDFDPAKEMPGIEVFVHPSPATTRFVNNYDEDGTRHQVVVARADDIELGPLPDEWRTPDALLLSPVAGELNAFGSGALEAGAVGAVAQGWLREIAPGGKVSARKWTTAARDLAGLTRGVQGLTLMTRKGEYEVPTLPRTEVDPTGAGDVFAAAFLVRYQEVGDPLDAASFAACAASCAVEGVGATSLGDRDEVLRRVELRDRFLEEGEWDE